MMVLDEEKLTYGTISMIGQDLGVEWEPHENIEEYADRVIKVIQK